MALHLFFVARIGFRAVSRVLSLLAWALGIKNAPCPQTISNWVIRLSIVRIEAARTPQGLPLRQAPFPNGLLWMLDLRIALGTGKMLAVLACDAQHHQRTPGPLSLEHVHCIGGGVAASWSGDTMAKLLKRLIAQMGRPTAYLKAGGSELPKAVDLLGEQELSSPCLDDISHAVAGMLKRVYQDHPSFETLLSACGRGSAKLKHTILACVAPPTVRPQARFMTVHRLFTWAERRLKLSPPGGAKAGSTVAKLRTSLDLSSSNSSSSSYSYSPCCMAASCNKVCCSIFSIFFAVIEIPHVTERVPLLLFCCFELFCLYFRSQTPNA